MAEHASLTARGYSPELRVNPTIPRTPSQQALIAPLLSKVSKESVQQFASGLSAFPERYYKSLNGLKSAQWIVDQVNNLQNSVATGAKLTVAFYKHPKWIQPSVIARYESTEASTKEGIVITGSHFDTAGFGGPKSEPVENPAADDCSSGSAAIYEALRVLITSATIPQRPIEFHWYAAEEFGLLGSKEIAASYADDSSIKVMVYLNLDQSGYVKAGTKAKFGLMTDGTSTGPSNFLKAVVSTYIPEYEIVPGSCGYQCTDHWPWFKAGFPTAMVFESAMKDSFPYNDKVARDGSFLDTLDKVNFDHVTQFARSTLAYLVECSFAA